MAKILVITKEMTFHIEGDSFHTQRDIGQVIISQKADTEGNKARTVAAFNCSEIIGVAYAENYK